MANETVREVITLPESIIPVILGSNDIHLKMIRDAIKVEIAVRGGEISIGGTQASVTTGVKLVSELADIARVRELTTEDVMFAIKMVTTHETTEVAEILTDSIKVAGRAKRVTPKSPMQQSYTKSIKDNDIVFGIGPAGTGKTYLAMAMAVHYFLEKRVSRIILTRPAVEAGEKLGFLPGDLAEKINPYLRPLYDALYTMMDFEHVTRLMEKGIIEVAPLAFMRGRTLNDCFVILDEAQNTTPEQMKMFLTRLGFNSKAVVTGDVTQVDLPTEKKSGLVAASEILQGIEGLEFVRFTDKDVVRHPLVSRIIMAYDKFEEAQAKKNGKR